MCAYGLSTIDTCWHNLYYMSSEILKKFASKLIQIRKERNLSQEEFAFLCGIDRTYIGRIERLERKPTIVVLDKIAKGLDIDLKDLLDFE